MFLKTFSLFNAFEPIHKFLQLCLLYVVNVHISKGKEGVLLVKGSLENVLRTPTSALVKVGARTFAIEVGSRHNFFFAIYGIVNSVLITSDQLWSRFENNKLKTIWESLDLRDKMWTMCSHR